MEIGWAPHLERTQGKQKKNLLLIPGSDRRFLGHPDRSVVFVPSEESRLALKICGTVNYAQKLLTSCHNFLFACLVT